MRKKKEKQESKRLAAARRFVDGNKLFLVMAVIGVIGLFSGNLIEKKEPPETEVQAEQQEPEDDISWHFYWSDLIVFVAGGGFCTVMIVREKKRAKEELR